LFHFQYCFPFFKAFRPPMGATHPLIQWVPRAPSQGPTCLVSKLKASGILYIHSPTWFHVVNRDTFILTVKYFIFQ
jgi:hypothetical protein